jgi:hypothetical protein
MTVEELDAELAHMQDHLRRAYDDAIAECIAELETETNRYRREFVQAQLEYYRAIRARHDEGP